MQAELRSPLLENYDDDVPLVSAKAPANTRANAERTFSARFESDPTAFATRRNQVVRFHLVCLFVCLLCWLVCFVCFVCWLVCTFCWFYTFCWFVYFVGLFFLCLVWFGLVYYYCYYYYYAFCVWSFFYHKHIPDWAIFIYSFFFSATDTQRVASNSVSFMLSIVIISLLQRFLLSVK